MTQAQEDASSDVVPGHLPSRISLAAGHQSSSGWLVLADPDGPIDLQRLFPDVEVRLEPTSAEFSEALAHCEPSLVVLITPPAEPGDLQLVASWLAANPDAYAVLLSPHQAVAMRLHALELGFDDAVDLSSDPMEVVGRLSIVGRRGPATGHVGDDRIAVGDGVDLDLRARAIRRDGRLISLRPKELALLEFMATHPGRAFAREELLRHVWHEAIGNERMVDVYVFWLRAKIERDAANPDHLLTVRGSGYLFDPPRGSSPAGPGGLNPTPTYPADPANVNEPPTPR
jgi:two-component system phosphate regulon response regulator OmpR